ncbi:hypothetical protein M409DRAFT_68307 [Zasmidium cellare ATCC 36951]|uniref:Tyrosinase copper-binding domain-containing protein n=1 Tax=Zasmidium cellare ATCC 36951 TaxID=1080233 RepID=A0A6A6CA62_ZASCE|nr:uncharacterized protein M409DRAFT_68307 [Zasmidium cellare ATCC 36951]KAF2163713.1 hypothetical protein M409DRAFT_68307 [Zasmidium cellare ATCC 36951]
MRFIETIVSALTGSSTFVPASSAGTDKLAAQALRTLRRFESSQPQGYGANCSLKTAYRRREWETFSRQEKREYIDAILCLMEKPSISGDLAPGARSRYDDFLAIHINQTGSIHGTGSFLSWHRYFTFTYEQALRDECGYTGYQPYLNWPKYALDLYNAPVFDGSDTSMSGNGCYRKYNGTNIPSNDKPFIVLPPGEAGGCVESGPFKDMQVRLGPVAPAVNDAPPNPQKDGLGYNPRCLRRDMSAYAAERWNTDQNVTDLILQSNNIFTFQNTMQGDFPKGFLGVHTSGHFFVGSDPGGDLFSSPGDPYFFLHHAQIDRCWWIWQNIDPWHRIEVIAGTHTVNNDPPSANATLDDIIDLGVNAPGIAIRDAVSTLEGPFCYIYE